MYKALLSGRVAEWYLVEGRHAGVTAECLRGLRERAVRREDLPSSLRDNDWLGFPENSTVSAHRTTDVGERPARETVTADLIP